jgi:hypothetical protein
MGKPLARPESPLLIFQPITGGYEIADTSDMNVNSLSNVSDSYLQSLIGNSLTSATGSSGTDSSSLTLPQDGNPQISSFAQILSTLQQLQQSNPSEYQQVTSQIATNLQSAAKTATADGNTAQANELNQLASDFTNASQNNTLPNIQDLAQALGGHGHHHHHMGSQSSDSTSTSDTSSTSGSSDSTNASSTENPMSQLISAFLSNSSSVAQNSSLDPFSIISNTLNGAGL